MPNLIDVTPDQRFVGLFIGPSGSGKTCAECSFPKPLLNLDFDGRIRGAFNQTFLPMEGISYESFPPRKPGLVTTLDKMLEAIDMAGRVQQPIPRSLIMDSLTSECFAMLCQSSPLTHSDGKTQGQPKKGKFLGTVAMAGPEDYGFEAQMTYNIMSWFRSVPVQNIIVSAHVVPVFGKEDPNNEYSNSIQIGEKLSVRDKIGANIGIYFDHVFQFRKSEENGKEKFWVKFRGELARTAFKELPEGWVDITGKNFYNDVLMHYAKPITTTAV
jgi:hypothetical protein